MKKLFIGVLVAASFANVALADEFTGARVGIGYSQNEIEDIDAGTGFKVEAGYDFNKIIGATLSYESNSDSFIEDIDIDNTAIKAGADIGYAFATEIETLFIKPYVNLGLQKYDVEISGGGLSESVVDDTSLFYGLGARFVYQSIYANLSLDKSKSTDEAGDDLDVTQTSISLGYKF